MALLTTLDSGMYSPTLCIRAGVYQCINYITPNSGVLRLDPLDTYRENWPQYYSMRQQNSRINGRYSLEDNFEQGYFNFENWSGQVCYDTLWNKSGYQANVGIDNRPYLVNFWGNNNTVTGLNASYRYGYESDLTTSKIKNLTTSVVMSGTASDPSKKMDIYTGLLSSGNITAYGRVGMCNTSFGYDDKILAFSTIEAGTSTGETGWIFPTQNYSTTWTSPDNIESEDGINATLNFNQTGVGPGGASDIIWGYNFNPNLVGYTITSIELEFNYQRISGNTSTNYAYIIWDGIQYVSQKKVPFNGNTYGNGVNRVVFYPEDWDGSNGLRAMTDDDISDSRMRIGVDFIGYQTSNSLSLDYIKINISYVFEGTSSLALYMRNVYGTPQLCWRKNILGSQSWVGLNGNIVEDNNFVNFLVKYNEDEGYGYFYYAKDDEPLTLVSIESLGDISSVFRGVTSFYETSHSGYILNNPKIISDFGVSNRGWTSRDVSQFNHHRLNPAYYLNDNVITKPPQPSGSDTDCVNFHFPIKSSGTLGSCHSTNHTAINYYVPLNSGISERFFEFDRSQFNNTALAVDMWVQNSGTNPSGNLGARIDFCDKTSLGGMDYYTVKGYWSGFPISINNDGIHQVRMSGLIFNQTHGLSDLYEVSKNRVNNSNLYMGAWYNNIVGEYNGDIKVYSTRVKIDSWCTPPSTGNALTLYTSGQVKAMESLDLYLQQSTVWDGIDLYIQGTQSTNSGIPLYIAGDFAFNQFPLYIGGKDSANSGIPLTITGGTESAAMPLYIYSEPASQMSGNVPLYMWATTNSGMSNSMSLFIGENAPSGVTSAGMNLYVGGPDSARVTASMLLFLKREAYSEQSFFTLYCHNAYTLQSGNLTMFLQAPSGTLGAIPVSGAMNLFIARDSEATAHNMTLYTTGPNSSSESLQFYINGGTPYFSSVDLYTNGIGEAESNPLKFYTHGF